MTSETTENPGAVGSPVDCPVRPLRLYVVRVMREAYVLAEDEAGAEAQADEIARWEDPIVEAGSGSERLDGWEPADSCLVYNNDGLDITLAQARQLFDAA
jgi:hypothetical protein